MFNYRTADLEATARAAREHVTAAHAVMLQAEADYAAAADVWTATQYDEMAYADMVIARAISAAASTDYDVAYQIFRAATDARDLQWVADDAAQALVGPYGAVVEMTKWAGLMVVAGCREGDLERIEQRLPLFNSEGDYWQHLAAEARDIEMAV